MAKFGIVEMTRTGRICLRRGEALLEQGSNLPEEPERAGGSQMWVGAGVRKLGGRGQGQGGGRRE